MAEAVQSLGDDVLAATDLRQRIRRHPWVATGVGAMVGYVGGPRVLRGIAGALGFIAALGPLSASSSSKIPPGLGLRPRHRLPGLVLGALGVSRQPRS